ncbi:hypothetical protein [Mesorhizobium sp. IMUNJ 23232]|uniref:hypothetical protein n=1 Tax=Mesorhizobium sp. IMUNJ 23232 TaxID=3376064 RepID=UPI00378C31BB
MSERTTAELERDAEAARARVADTAESIRNRMTPGQMIDEFSGLFSGGDGATALGNLKAQVRDNPLPLTLIGTGLAWLMLGNGPTSHAPSQGNGLNRPAARPDFGNSSVGDAASRSGGPSASIKTAASESASALGDMVSNAARSAKSTAADTSEAVRDNLSEGKRWVEDIAGGATNSVGDIAAKARQSATDLFENEPLIIAALGLAVGTAIGAMLPRTTLEDQNLGAYSDKVRGAAKDLMEKGVEGAKEVAADAYQTVKDEADRVGMSQTGDTSLVGKVTEVVKSTSAKTEDAIREKIVPPHPA